MGNDQSASGTLSSLNQTQIEETQNSLLNRYQFNTINGKLKLNGTDVHPDEIRDLLSNKNAQRVLLQKAFESGWENISGEQEEKFIQTIHHLAPFESSSGTISSDNNSTLNRQEGLYQLRIPFPMKNQQFAQHMQKIGENNHDESIQQSSVQDSKYQQANLSKGSSLNSNKIVNMRNDFKNGSISFAGGSNAMFQKGISHAQSHRSNQSDSVMQFHCDEFGSARNNMQLNNQLSNIFQGNFNQSSRRNVFQQSGQQLLTHIKETEDSIEKDYSLVEDLDVVIPEINFQYPDHRRGNSNLNESQQVYMEGYEEQNEVNMYDYQSQQIQGQQQYYPNYQMNNQVDDEGNIIQREDNFYIDNENQQQQSVLPNNSSVYQYQGGQTNSQCAEVQKRYLNLEQLIRSRKSSKQISDGIHSANGQESASGQSPLNAELVRNYFAMNESQLSICNQGDLNERQLEILRELVKEDQILKTIQKTLQSQQNTSREQLQNQQLSNKYQNNCQQQQRQQMPQNIAKQLQSAFEKESNDLPRISMQIQKPESKPSTGFNSIVTSQKSSMLNPQNQYQGQIEQFNKQIRENKFENSPMMNQNNQQRQSLYQNHINSLEEEEEDDQNIFNNHSQQNQINQINQFSSQSSRPVSSENITAKQKPNISVDQFSKKEILKEQFSNRHNQVNNTKGVPSEQLESCDNISQYYNEGYSYRTMNSFKSNEQKKRSMSYNTTGNNQQNNRSTSSFGFGNDEKQQSMADMNFQSQSIGYANQNGQMSASNVQLNMQNSMNLSGVQYRICTNVNQENVENPIKKIRSFSSHSRQANQTQQSNRPVIQILDQTNQNAKTNELLKANVFQTSTQILEQQNSIKSTKQIKLNQLNILNSSFQTTSNHYGNNLVGGQLNPASNKSVQEISNIFQNCNSSMNNSFNGGLNSSYADCLNVNQSFEKKFKKLRSVSHQDNNRSSYRNSTNNIHLQQLFNCNNNKISEESQQQHQQQYLSLLNAISSINTQQQNNTNNSFITNQQGQAIQTEDNRWNTNVSDVNPETNFKNFKQPIQQQQPAYDSVNSQKSSGFRGISGKENYDSLSNRNRCHPNQIVSFNSSNKMRFMTIQEQTENSNYPSINSQQIQPQQQQQTMISRQSMISQQERQSKIISSDNDKDGCIYSDIKSQQAGNSYCKPEIKNISIINDNMRKNNTYFNCKIENEDDDYFNNENNNVNDFNKFIQCKNVQSISNTPISKSGIESNSSRIISRTHFQQQNKDNSTDNISPMSSNIKSVLNEQIMIRNLSNSNSQPGLGKVERISYNVNNQNNLQRDNSNNNVVKILNESHIQYTSKKQLQCHSVNASYIYTPSKQVSLNALPNDQIDNLMNTPNQSNLSKNAAISIFGEKKLYSNDNSLMANYIAPPIRSISTDSRVNVFTNINNNNLEFKKTIGIRKYRSGDSNNNSLITNQNESQFNQINNESNQHLSINNSNIKVQQHQQQQDQNLLQQKFEEEVVELPRFSLQMQGLNRKMSEKHEIKLAFLKESTDKMNNNINPKIKNLAQQIQNVTDQFHNQQQQQRKDQSDCKDNKINEKEENTIYQRNKNLIEQIKLKNQDIFKQSTLEQQIEEKQPEQEYFMENLRSEQKFGVCNEQTVKKEEQNIESAQKIQTEGMLKKQYSLLSNREKSQNQYSDNKYKRSDLKLNDSIDFNKDQSENNDQDYYVMKNLDIQQNTNLTNESQEKLKEIVKKAKLAQQNKNQSQIETKPTYQNLSQGKEHQQYADGAESVKIKQAQYISVSQALINSFDHTFKNEKDFNSVIKIQKDDPKLNIYSQKSDQNDKSFATIDKSFQQQTAVDQDITQQQNTSQQVSFKITAKQNSNSQIQNQGNDLQEDNLQNQEQSLSCQSQNLYLDTFKQQYFEQDDEEKQAEEDAVINGEGEEFDDEVNMNDQNNYQFQQGFTQCLTETSRKDNQCLDEISSQLKYLKQRSKNMDSSIQSEINFLEEKISKIFSKIKYEKESKSKENSFMGSTNHHNNSTNNKLNQLPESNQSSVHNLQHNTKKIANSTTASNSHASSKFLSQQYQQISTSQQQLRLSKQLVPNQQISDKNLLYNEFQNEDLDQQEILSQENIMPVDQPLALEQPESQFSDLSIETLRQNSQQKCANVNKSSSRNQLNFSNQNNNYGHEGLKRFNQLQSQLFNNNQSVSNQIEEPYEVQDEQQQQYLQQQSSSNLSKVSSQLQKKGGEKIQELKSNYFKYQNKNNEQKMIDGTQSNQNIGVDSGSKDQMSNQQFADYFEQQVNSNCQQAQEQLNQSDSFYSSASNRLGQNSVPSKSQIQNQYGTLSCQQKNQQNNMNNGLLSCSASNRSSQKSNTLSNLNSNNNINNTNSTNSLHLVDRQKKDLELLKIMHILEENPNNVINSIKQFETLDSQQMQNELMQQIQSQREFEQQYYHQQNQHNTNNISHNNYQEYNNYLYNNPQTKLNAQGQQAQQAKDQIQEANFFQNQQIVKTQVPLFEMSLQDWQNASASFPNNSTQNNSQMNTKSNNLYQYNQEEHAQQELCYNEFTERVQDYQRNEDLPYQKFVQKQIIQNRAKITTQGSSQQHIANDISDKENKVPEQKINLIELLQKKQLQQQQFQQQAMNKKTLLALQENNINIQLDFNTPLISTKSIQNHQSKLKNDQTDEDYSFPIQIDSQMHNQKQQNQNRHNHHQGNHYQRYNQINLKSTPEKYMSSNNISANTSKTNTAKKLQNSRSSQKIIYQNGSSQALSDYNEEQKNQRQKTHEKITQLYNQHKNFILQQEKINQEQDMTNSSSINYWKIRNADSRKRSRNSSNSGPRSTGKEKNNSKDKEKNPKNQLTEIVNFLNEQQRMNKPIFDIIKQSSLPHQQGLSQNNISSQSTKFRSNNNYNLNNNFK